jgi:parvulin-like peptidyl-prolyl isomerase
MRAVVLVLLLAYNAAALFLWSKGWRLDAVATVAGSTISKSEFERTLRDQLFRRGWDWAKLDSQGKQSLRQAVLDDLADAARIRQAASGVEMDLTSSAVDAEFQDFLAEFDPKTEFTRRLGLQRDTEKTLVERIALLQREQAWLEQQLGEDSAAPANLRSALPEVWRARHLFLSGHEAGKPDRTAEISALHQQIVSGAATLDDLIRKHSEDERTKLKAGDLGYFTAARMPEDFMEAVKGAKLKTMTQPFRTKLGWHLLEVTEHRAAQDLATTEALPESTALEQHRARQEKLAVILSELRASAEITLNPLLPLDSLGPL